MSALDRLYCILSPCRPPPLHLPLIKLLSMMHLLFFCHSLVIFSLSLQALSLTFGVVVKFVFKVVELKVVVHVKVLMVMVMVVVVLMMVAMLVIMVISMLW